MDFSKQFSLYVCITLLQGSNYKIICSLLCFIQVIKQKFYKHFRYLVPGGLRQENVPGSLMQLVEVVKNSLNYICKQIKSVVMAS